MTTTANPYQSPGSTGLRDETAAGFEDVLARVAISLSTLFAVVVLTTRGTLHEQFDDLDADLPALTQLILSSAFAIIVVVLSLLTVINQRMLHCKALRMTWHICVIVVVLTLVVLCAIALYLPTLQIGERLG